MCSRLAFVPLWNVESAGTFRGAQITFWLRARVLRWAILEAIGLTPKL